MNTPKTTTGILSVIVVVVCSIRFLMDGVDFHLGPYNLTFSHVESMAYTAILAPVLGAHSYIKARMQPPKLIKKRVDNPDA